MVGKTSQKNTIPVIPAFGIPKGLQTKIAQVLEKEGGSEEQLSMFPRPLDEIEVSGDRIQKVRDSINDLFESSGVGAEIGRDGLRIIIVQDEEDRNPRRRLGNYGAISGHAI